jgi:unsaturated rhamnogalacturonyl hydrolase
VKASEAMSHAARRTMEWPFRLWGFGEAIALRGLLRAAEAQGDREPLGFVHGLLRAWIAKGVGRTADDHTAPGCELLAFYQMTGDGAFLDGARSLAALLASFPQNCYGARLHRSDQPGWRRQIWVDCMESDGPFLALLGALTGDGALQDEAAGQACAYCRCLQDENSGLFWHGFETECGRNGQVWARGNGWALLGLTGVLRSLDAAHPLALEIRQRLEALARGLAACQDASGLWRTVLADDSTYLETTLAAMAAWGLREAFDRGILPESAFADMEWAARAAVKRNVRDDGVLEKVSDATPIGELRQYATRPFGVFPWGQGPLLLMLAQEEGACELSA